MASSNAPQSGERNDVSHASIAGIVQTIKVLDVGIIDKDKWIELYNQDKAQGRDTVAQSVTHVRLTTSHARSS